MVSLEEGVLTVVPVCLCAILCASYWPLSSRATTSSLTRIELTYDGFLGRGASTTNQKRNSLITSGISEDAYKSNYACMVIDR